MTTVQFVLALLCCMSVLIGCRWESPLPESEKDALIAEALSHAVITARNVPGYKLLDKVPAIILDNTTRVKSGSSRAINDSLTAHSLPHSDSIKFMLLSPAEILDRAEQGDAFLYLSVPVVEVRSDTAEVYVATRWAVPKNYRGLFLSGGTVRLRFVTLHHQWTFERITLWIIS